MKNTYKLLFLTIALVFNGCADEDKGPIFIYNELEIGAYVRGVEKGENLLPIVTVDSFNNFSHTYQVEFVDESKGSLVQEYRVDIEYFPLGEKDSTENNKKSENFIMYTLEQFIDRDNGHVGTPEIEFSSSDLMDGLGLTFDSLEVTDEIRFVGELTLKDGRKFNSVTSSPTVNGSFFKGEFDFTIHVGCKTALDKSDHIKNEDGDAMKGSYMATTTVNTCKGQEVTKMVSDTVVVIRSGVIALGEYEFDDWTFGVGKDCFGPDTDPQIGFVFKDICGKVEFDDAFDSFGNEWNYTSTVSENEWTIMWDNGSDQEDLAKISGTTVITFPGDVPFSVD